MIIKKIAKHSNKPKVVVILGTTSSGKTSLGVWLARKFNGEIVSADSRQVYRGLDVGTGKDLCEYGSGRLAVPYHLIDVASPHRQFDVMRFQRLAQQSLNQIIYRQKIPFVVGGSGLYLQALIDNFNLRAITPNLVQRKLWETWSATKLLQAINSKRPDFVARLNNSDRHNARRLVRYLEIIESGSLENVVKRESAYDFLVLGLNYPDDILRQRIELRLLRRLEKEALIAEVWHLHNNGLSFQRLKSLGLEYKFISAHLMGEISYEQLVKELSRAIYRFAKRQKTWFKRWEKQGLIIKWLKNEREADSLVKNFINLKQVKLKLKNTDKLLIQ